MIALSAPSAVVVPAAIPSRTGRTTSYPENCHEPRNH